MVHNRNKDKVNFATGCFLAIYIVIRGGGARDKGGTPGGICPEIQQVSQLFLLVVPSDISKPNLKVFIRCLNYLQPLSPSDSQINLSYSAKASTRERNRRTGWCHFVNLLGGAGPQLCRCPFAARDSARSLAPMQTRESINGRGDNPPT